MTSFAVSFPSGADETVLFQMADGKIDNLRILAEPSDVAPLFPAEASVATARHASRLPLGAGAIGLLMAMAAAFIAPMRRVLLALAVAFVGAGVYLGAPELQPR